MRDRFGIRATAAAIIAVALLPGVPTATAQETNYLAPRTAAGKPNLNGIWQSINTANWNIEPHAAAPGLARERGASVAVPAGLGIVDLTTREAELEDIFLTLTGGTERDGE